MVTGVTTEGTKVVDLMEAGDMAEVEVPVNGAATVAAMAAAALWVPGRARTAARC